MSTYNSGFKGLKPLVQHNWDILGRSCSTRKIHQNALVAAYKKPKNLRDFLVRVKIPRVKEQGTGKEEPPKPRNLSHEKLQILPPYQLNRQDHLYCNGEGLHSQTQHQLQKFQHHLLHVMQKMWDTICGPNQEPPY